MSSLRVIDMTLDQALQILARVHLREDSEVGFVIEIGATPSFGSMVSEGEYVDAWAVVWQYTQGDKPTHKPDSIN
ncbi:hypothetical protein [Phyllobacterium lublinensis]|uniref:hypothetical protein n=1 Tax=Phyllobacterium lublinensis TaxID=2875708 RepID=UPI001CCDEB62|nr:hypothetical protein [Phyllobacterium sp. 2063]MBZ9656597.1 hypothetical protein [Phyllobacterium sp. 2063]